MPEANVARGGIRRRSERRLWGLPVVDVAIGPDAASGDMIGHARGIIAVGNVATGIVAVGGVARGVLAVGGVAIGIVAIGGVATALIALGGVSLGVVAAGGAALGYYALGGAAVGVHVFSATRQDPEAMRFFGDWIFGLDRLPPPPGD